MKDLKERNGEILLRFLHSLQQELQAGDALFLLGDIFDLWLSDHDVFVEKYREVIEALRALKAKSVRLVYFEGNHDLHLVPFWQDELGFEVYTSAHYFQLGNFVLRAEHGDLINLEDKAYLRYRAFTRHPVMEFLSHNLPGIFWHKVGEWGSKKSRKHSTVYRENHEQDLVKMIRNHAHRAYKQQPFDLLVSGHMHVRDDYSFEEASLLANSSPSSGAKRSRSINLGSWFEQPCAMSLAVEPESCSVQIIDLK